MHRKKFDISQNAGDSVSPSVETSVPNELISTLKQLKIAKAIAWLISERRKKCPSDKRFESIYRAEIVRKSKVISQDVDNFITKLEEHEIINKIKSYDDPDQWWALFVNDGGEEKLKSAIYEVVSD